MGRPGQEQDISVVTVTLLLEDYLGTKVIALNRYCHHDLTALEKEKQYITVLILSGHLKCYFLQNINGHKYSES